MGGFEGVLRKYGRPAAVHRGEMTQIGHAMVQSLFEKDGQWIPTPLGRKRQDRFLMLASAELDMDGPGEDGWVEWDGTAYDVVTAQSVELGDKRLYWWAVLQPRPQETVL